ncbi:MAG: HD domain-containing protein [Thermodesulfobacteriota bacterium]
MKKLHLKDLKERVRVDDSFLVAKKETGVSKAGKPYLNLKFMDRTGEVEARVWDDAEAIGRGFEKGDVARVRGHVVSYQGKLQLNVAGVTALSNGEFNMRDYLPATERDPEEMIKELDGVISAVGDKHIKGLLTAVFKDSELRGLFMTAPAAKAMHHPRLGGLIEHVLSLCKLGEFVSSHYRQLNRDLLTAGLILHDIGKIYELSYDGPFDYTDEGRLIGHITMGVEMVEAKIKEVPDFPRETSMLLKHMLLSHHGYLDFGSPKRPKTLEATALYYLDDLDAKMDSISSLIEKEGGRGNWTEFHRLYERFIYKGAPGSPGAEALGEKEDRVEKGKEGKGEKGKVGKKEPDLFGKDGG